MRPRNRKLWLVLVVLFIAVSAGVGIWIFQNSGQTTGSTASTWDPPEGLEVLRNMPELQGVTLDMNENFLRKLLNERKIAYRPVTAGTLSEYWITVPSGYQAYFRFNSGKLDLVTAVPPMIQAAQPHP